jgi:hypothetical protein
MSLAAYESLARLAHESRENRVGPGTTAGEDKEHEGISG